MGVTITLKNIPEDVYDSLKQAAQAHRRSINSEAIACLEQALLPVRPSHEDLIARARDIRAGFNGRKFKVADIQQAIDDDRP